MSWPIVSLLTVVVAFFALVFWAYRPSNKQRFDEYARIPIDDEPGSPEVERQSTPRRAQS